MDTLAHKDVYCQQQDLKFDFLGEDIYGDISEDNNNFRSSRPEVFCKKVFLKISQNS